VASTEKQGQGKWAGFARSETLKSVWLGWTELDVYADAFAENNGPASKIAHTQVLTWAGVEKGMVLSGIGNRETGEVRIVTRGATEEEVEKFGHDRVPVIIAERF
jgi:hypothetical protein